MIHRTPVPTCEACGDQTIPGRTIGGMHPLCVDRLLRHTRRPPLGPLGRRLLAAAAARIEDDIEQLRPAA